MKASFQKLQTLIERKLFWKNLTKIVSCGTWIHSEVVAAFLEERRKAAHAKQVIRNRWPMDDEEWKETWNQLYLKRKHE